MPLARDLRRIGAASLDLAFVAAGRLDGYFERGLQPWDHAAGALLVTEAGRHRRRRRAGRTTATSALTVASGPALFESLLRRGRSATVLREKIVKVLNETPRQDAVVHGIPRRVRIVFTRSLPSPPERRG